MAFNEMVQRMILEVPGMAAAYSRTLINEGLGLIYDSLYWSFQLQESGWLTPGLQFPVGPGNSTGTVTTTAFLNTVTGDAVASAAWLAYITGGSMPLFTSYQFRNPSYSLYNIVSFDLTNPAAIVLTLDRPWMEPGGVGQQYMIYQAYFPVPVADFKRFFTARDTTNNAPMDYWSYTQKDLAALDAERTIFDNPCYFVPYQVDSRPGSATLGQMLYELWPHPLDVLPYSYTFLRRGPQLVNPGDTVPYPLTEEAVLWRAKECAFVFKEAQKGEQVQRGSGADFRFLAEYAEAQYKRVIKPIRDRDRDLVDLYFTRLQQSYQFSTDGYSNQNGSLNVGKF